MLNVTKEIQKHLRGDLVVEAGYHFYINFFVLFFVSLTSVSLLFSISLLKSKMKKMKKNSNSCFTFKHDIFT